MNEFKRIPGLEECYWQDREVFELDIEVSGNDIDYYLENQNRIQLDIAKKYFSLLLK